MEGTHVYSRDFVGTLRTAKPNIIPEVRNEERGARSTHSAACISNSTRRHTCHYDIPDAKSLRKGWSNLQNFETFLKNTEEQVFAIQTTEYTYIYIVVPIDIDIGMYRWLKRKGGRARNIHTYTRIKRNIENSGHLFHANSSEAASISLWEREREKTVRAFDFTRVISTRYGLSSKCYQLRYENYKINQRLRWKEAKYSSHVARKLKYGQSVSVS